MHELRIPSLVDPVEDERDSCHEGGSEERGVALEALLDHGGRVHHRVGRGVPDPEITYNILKILTLQGDPFGWLTPLVNLVLTVQAAGGPLLLLHTA